MLEGKRNLSLARLHGVTLCLLFALIALFMAKAPPLYAGSQVTLIPPFVGDHSETFEEFPVEKFGTTPVSIFGGLATVTGHNNLETATVHMFFECSLDFFVVPHDGSKILGVNLSGSMTIVFAQPLSAFGAYFANAANCVTDPQTVTFFDTAGVQIGEGNVAGIAADGGMIWHGYAFNTPVKTIVYKGDGPTIDGLQATLASNSGWSVVGVADFNRDGHLDYLLYNGRTRQTAIWYLNNNVFSSGLNGPTLPAGWSVVGVADFNGDGHPDYLLFNSSTRQTAIWYLNNNAFSSGLSGPTLPGG